MLVKDLHQLLQNTIERSSAFPVQLHPAIPHKEKHAAATLFAPRPEVVTAKTTLLNPRSILEKFDPHVLIQSPPEGELMTNLSGVVQQLKKAQAKAQGEADRLGAALAALGNLTGRRLARTQRTLSASARRKISLAQKARWAKWASKTQKGTARAIRKMSTAARRKIAAAQRARWAKLKASKE